MFHNNYCIKTWNASFFCTYSSVIAYLNLYINFNPKEINNNFHSSMLYISQSFFAWCTWHRQLCQGNGQKYLEFSWNREKNLIKVRWIYPSRRSARVWFRGQEEEWIRIRLHLIAEKFFDSIMFFPDDARYAKNFTFVRDNKSTSFAWLFLFKTKERGSECL